MPKNNLIVILGATASGKTKLAVQLAYQLDTEIISVDSRQVFKGMDIGTGKDLNEYNLPEKTISHHLINIKNAGENYSVNAFITDFYKAFTLISAQKKTPILCGGTGMYVHSLLQNYQLTAVPVNQNLRDELSLLNKIQLQNILNVYPQELRKHADYNSAKRLIRAIEIAAYLQDNQLQEIVRPTLNPVVIGLQTTVETRRERILDRLNTRLNFGLIAEVEQLLASGVSAQMLTFYGLEYKYVVAYLMGEINLETLKETLGIAICQFAKRQLTFFRKMEKDGVKINWLNAEQELNSLKNDALKLIKNNF